MSELQFSVRREGAVARIDLGRPEEGNAVTRGTKALTYLVYSAESVDAQQAVTLGLASKVLAQASFASDADAFLKKLASRPRLVLETIKRYQSKASQLTPDMASEYAGTLLALVRS